jgi:hypothetical protein
MHLIYLKLDNNIQKSGNLLKLKLEPEAVLNETLFPNKKYNCTSAVVMLTKIYVGYTLDKLARNASFKNMTFT